MLAWLEGGGPVDATCERGQASGITLLMAAASRGHERVVELLLQRGAEINLQSGVGWTALMCAAGEGHPAVVLRLLRAGADTAVRSEDGKTALQWANEKCHAACVGAFRQHIEEVTAAQREAAGGAGGAPSGEAAAGARAAASSGSLGSLPAETARAAGRGEEAALLAWLDSGGRVHATCGVGM